LEAAEAPAGQLTGMAIWVTPEGVTSKLFEKVIPTKAQVASGGIFFEPEGA